MKQRALLGFGNTRQAARQFRMTQKEVLQKAASGEWPSWIIGGKRCFDLDVIAKRNQEAAT